MKKQKGITLISLLITIVLMFIIAGTTIYTSKNRFKVNNLNKMYNDIELLSNKIDNYYIQYGGIPVLRNNSNEPIQYTFSTLDFDKNVNDNDLYYIIDLAALGDITLNYGKEGYEDPNTSDDVYIINEKTHTVYYVKGIEYTDGNIYHSKPIEENTNEDTIPPTKPQINVVSGKEIGERIYLSNITLEFIPGKDNWSGVSKTTYSINGSEEVDISTLKDNKYDIISDGIYEIILKTYDSSTLSNFSENTLNINIYKIPTGFYYVEGTTIEEGYVISDVEGDDINNTKGGNQYVWVPVTKNEDGTPTEPYAATNGKMTTSKGEVEIQLQRNGFGSSINRYTEDTSSNHNSDYGNAIAKDIEKFKESVSKNGGYFIGRYEAGIEEGTLDTSDMPNGSTAPNANWTGYTGGKLVVKAGEQVWNYVTQNKASELCRNIDSNYTGITSDLINSYAWDTAIIYIQMCGENSNYASQVGESTTLSDPSKTGEATLKSTSKKDMQCNIYDMAGNCHEWSTETFNDSDYPCVGRGGIYSNSQNKTSDRDKYSFVTHVFKTYSFRPILYW